MPELDEYMMERVIEGFEQRCYDNMNHAIETEEGLGIEYDEDVVCDVCQSPDGEDGNEMVFCDKCNICVHQVWLAGGWGGCRDGDKSLSKPLKLTSWIFFPVTDIDLLNGCRVQHWVVRWLQKLCSWEGELLHVIVDVPMLRGWRVVFCLCGRSWKVGNCLPKMCMVLCVLTQSLLLFCSFPYTCGANTPWISAT